MLNANSDENNLYNYKPFLGKVFEFQEELDFSKSETVAFDASGDRGICSHQLLQSPVDVGGWNSSPLGVYRRNHQSQLRIYIHVYIYIDVCIYLLHIFWG